VTSGSSTALERRETRLAWRLMVPALGLLALVGAAPLVATGWESLHRHDVRLPWLGRPFVGFANYRQAFHDDRFVTALEHTVVFTAVSVTLELSFGLAFALALDALARGRAVARVVLLLPWALPTVVAALVWRFLFEGQSGIVNATLVWSGLAPREWLAGSFSAWVPIVFGDVWKSTPFVALLLLAGLQGIDASLYEAARLDGAGSWRRFVEITLPLVRPALVVALAFRALDAFRVFDLVYVLTGGGPGAATEVVSLYAFTTLLQDLQFGYASALAMLVFLMSFMLALFCIPRLRVSVAPDR